MIEIHFGTPRFESLKFPHFPPPRTLLPRVHDLPTGVLPQISGCELLHLFRLRKFQNFPPALSPGVTLSQTQRSFDMFLLESMVDMYFGLREFSTQCNLSHISLLECLVSRLHDLSPHGEILEEDMCPISRVSRFTF
jgi:hypothetical protein